MAGHSVAANLVMLVCVVGGFLSLRNMKQEVFPDVALDTVSVTVAYPGASPEEVESGILLAIEESVRGLEGVYEVVSVAREGVGMVTVELLLGADVQRLAQEIKSEVDRIVTFPEEAEEPEVRIDQHRRNVLTVALYGDAPDTVLHRLGEDLRDDLLQSPDITQVDLQGVPPLEISIEVAQDQLRRYGLTLGDVAARLLNAAADIPGGGLRTRAGEVLVRLRERRDYGRQFATLPIVTTADGSEVLLRDITTIDDSFAETDRYAKYNGKRAVLLDVYRVGDETPIQVADAVRAQLAAFAPHLPPGIATDIHSDRSDTYRQRVMLLLKNGGIGLCLILVVLGLFLEARLAFWVMMGMVISFLGAFLFLPSTNVTINMMSLFAFIIALGIVVDNAIVVGENVYQYHQRGMPFLAAAIHGAREVATPVTYSILTNIATFVPLYFIPGTIGKTYKMVPIVVCLVFILSLLESLFVLPSQLGHQQERARRGLTGWLHRGQQGFSRAFAHWVSNRYGPFLLFMLRHRYLTVATAVGLLTIMMAYPLSGRMGFQLFPIVESDYADAQLVLPYGAPVERTEAIIERLEDRARRVCAEGAHPELIKAIVTDVGLTGSHTGRVRVELAPPEIRNAIMGTEAFTRRWRDVVGEVPGVETLRFASDSGGPGGRGRPIAVELSHRDMDVLEQSSTELAEILATYPGVEDIDDGFQPGKPQLDFTIKPEGQSLGLSAREIARQVRHAFYGAEVLRQQRGRNELKIMVRLPRADRSTEQTIHDLLIRTPDGAYVPFREVAAIERGRAFTTIDRRNGQRVVQVSADITPRAKAGEVLADLRNNVLPGLMRNHPGLAYSFEGHQADIRESMASLRVTFVIALLVVYALLAIPFRSYTQPFVVMLSIPFGIVGAFLGHLIMGYDLCIPSMFGIVALSGVVINGSLVMIDFANRRRQADGLSHHDAIHAAAVQRFRPILLTTLTTFGGLAPMIFETSRQARFLIPMALSLGYGILFATFITLVIVPSLYLVIEDIRDGVGRVWRAAASHFEEPEKVGTRDQGLETRD
ncbi:MAG TPA: efflux RND transporter permease subunit [Candidatus Hydrogenedentes bacterium]|nr:efflux RND transporter permease subunit [Candidatus Hydrogenedentota bacterium]